MVAHVEFGAWTSAGVGGAAVRRSGVHGLGQSGGVQITSVVQMSSGDIVVNTQTVARDNKPTSVQYSTAYVSWIGPDPNFQVLSIQVKAVVGSKAVSKPFPGRNYDNGGTN